MLLFELGEHEAVEVILRPSGIIDRRRGVGLRGDEGPVFGIDTALCDPALEHRALGGGQRTVQFGRRHGVLRVLGVDAGHEFAQLRLARHDGPLAALQLGRRALQRVEPQAGLAFRGVRPVAGKAAVRQQRPHVAVKVHGGTKPRRGQSQTGTKEMTKSMHRGNPPAPADDSFLYAGRVAFFQNAPP